MEGGEKQREVVWWRKWRKRKGKEESEMGE